MPTGCWLALHAASGIVVGHSTRSLDSMKKPKRISAATLRSLVVVLTAVALWLPMVAISAQVGIVHRVGWISSGSKESSRDLAEEVRLAFRELGYRDDELVLEFRFAEGRSERLSEIAADLVALKPDVIFSGATPGTRAASVATRTIPIVFAGVADPVEAGFVNSLAHPGRNITGFSNFAIDTASKQLGLLRLVIPKSKRIGLLVSDNPAMVVLAREIQATAERQGIAIMQVSAVSLQEIETAFATLKAERAEGLIVMSDTPTMINRGRVAELAAKYHLPAIYSYSVQVEAGGLMSYGPDPKGLVNKIASYIDRILKGSKAGDLAVQGPTEFELAVNLRSANALGVTFPPEILLRAQRIIGK